MITTCPECGTRLKRVKERLPSGAFVEAWSCPKHASESYMDLYQYGAYFEAIERKAFKLGGSLAVRLPKKLADDMGIKDGTPLRFKRQKKSIVIEPVED